jgi:lysophospholipase L1-like esterase
MRIVAFGDSITLGVRTDGTLREEQAWRAVLSKRLNAAGGGPWEIINAGIGGNTTADGIKRFEADALANKPDIVTLMFGVNDAAMLSFPDFRPIPGPRVALAEYRKNLTEMIARVRSVALVASNQWHPRVMLMTPCPMGNKYFNKHLEPYKSHDKNYVLRSYAQAVREIAAELGVELVDVWTRFLQEGMNELLPDGVHPNPRGHEVIAGMLFRAIQNG